MSTSEKIKITQSQYDKFKPCLDLMGIDENDAVEDKFADYVIEMSHAIKYLTNDIDNLDDNLADVSCAMKNESTDGIINELLNMIKNLSEITEDVEMLKENLQNAICAFRDATEV